MEHQTLRRAVLGLFSLSVLGFMLLVKQETTAQSPTTMAVVYMPYLQDSENKTGDKVQTHSNKRVAPPCKTESQPVQTHKVVPQDPFKQLLRGIMI